MRWVKQSWSPDLHNNFKGMHASALFPMFSCEVGKKARFCSSAEAHFFARKVLRLRTVALRHDLRRHTKQMERSFCLKPSSDVHSWPEDMFMIWLRSVYLADGLKVGCLDSEEKPNSSIDLISLHLPFRVWSSRLLEASKQEKAEAEEAEETVSAWQRRSQAKRLLAAEELDASQEVATEIASEEEEEEEAVVDEEEPKKAKKASKTKSKKKSKKAGFNATMFFFLQKFQSKLAVFLTHWRRTGKSRRRKRAKRRKRSPKARRKKAERKKKKKTKKWKENKNKKKRSLICPRTADLCLANLSVSGFWRLLCLEAGFSYEENGEISNEAKKEEQNFLPWMNENIWKLFKTFSTKSTVGLIGWSISSL